jgi:hypothetical protein
VWGRAATNQIFHKGGFVEGVGGDEIPLLGFPANMAGTVSSVWNVCKDSEKEESKNGRVYCKE